MATKRQPTGKETWTEKERLRLWQLREENPHVKWSQFRNRFFPHRTTGALMTRYSSMKTRKIPLEPTEAPKQGAVQDNTHQPPNEAAELPPSKRRKSTPRGADNGGGDLSSSVEGSASGSERECETESESDSEAGDIPYENGPSKRPSQPLLQPYNAGQENSRGPLAKKKTQTGPSTDNNEGTQESSTQTTLRSIKNQSPSDPGARAGLNGTVPQSSENSQVYLSPVDSPEITATTVRQAPATQPAAGAVPVLSGDQYTSLFQTFQQAAAIFAHYPQVMARAEKAEGEYAEKQRTIQQMQVSHDAEKSELRNRLTTQNASMQEQKARIEGLLAQMQTVGEQQRNKINELASRVNAMEDSVAKQTPVEAPGHDGRKDGEHAECTECPTLRQENHRLTEEMANIRDLLNRVIPARVPQSPPTRAGAAAEARAPGSAP